MRKLTTSITLLLLLGSMTAYADDLIIRASPACADWTKGRQIDKGRGAMVQTSWLMGYLSGLAMGSETDIFKNAAPNESLFLWMDHYCESYTTNTIGEGANVLYWEMIRKLRK